MKCKHCTQEAVIRMPEHRLKLCGEHFDAWMLKRVARTVKRFSMFTTDERLLVAVSGGKDSLAVWDILTRLGYAADGLYIHLGIPDGDYSDVSQRHAEAYATAHGLKLIVADVAAETGRAVPDLVERRVGRRVCSACGLVKRHIMNDRAHRGGYAALITGHNLDDEAATLMQNNIRWKTGYLGRQAPVLPARDGLTRKCKPLALIHERESAAYALLHGIDYVDQECPHAARASSLYWKGLLSDMELRSPGVMLSYYSEFLRARDEGRLTVQEEALELHPCPNCGQPTMVDGACAFCRLMEVQHDDAH